MVETNFSIHAFSSRCGFSPNRAIGKPRASSFPLSAFHLRRSNEIRYKKEITPKLRFSTIQSGTTPDLFLEFPDFPDLFVAILLLRVASWRRDDLHRTFNARFCLRKKQISTHLLCVDVEEQTVFLLSPEAADLRPDYGQRPEYVPNSSQRHRQPHLEQIARVVFRNDVEFHRRAQPDAYV